MLDAKFCPETAPVVVLFATFKAAIVNFLLI